jgi:hypothetical protein
MLGHIARATLAFGVDNKVLVEGRAGGEDGHAVVSVGRIDSRPA